MKDYGKPLDPARQAIIDEQRTARRETNARRGAVPLFRDGVWVGGDFSSTAWTREVFAGSDLRGTNFRGCSFFDADLAEAKFHDADLRDADLTGARNLLPQQLAGADLTRARLPEAVAKFPALAHSDRLSENAAKVFFTFLLAMVFAVVTAASIKDFDLINNRGTAKLPVLNADVPALHFMWGVSLLLCILFLYLHIYLQRLWEVLATLPAVLPDGRNLDEATHPWLINDLCRDHIPRLRRQRHVLARIQNCVCGVLAYVLPAFVMVYLWAGGIRTQQPWIIWWQFIFLAVVIATAPCFSVALRFAFARERAGVGALLRLLRKPFLTLMLIVGVLLLYGTFSLSWAQVRQNYEPTVINGVFQILGGRRVARAEGGQFSERPKGWPGLAFATEKDVAAVPPAAFQNVCWHGLEASGSFLAHCFIGPGEVSQGKFDGIEGAGSAWMDLKLRQANFRGSRFNLGQHPGNAGRSVFRRCELNDANLLGAWVEHLLAVDCHFDGASLAQLHGAGSVWVRCSFVDATFHGADLTGAYFAAETSDRTEGDSTLTVFDMIAAGQGACDFSEADFGEAILKDADFSEATGLTLDQLQDAKDVTGMILPEEWKGAHSDWVGAMEKRGARTK